MPSVFGVIYGAVINQNMSADTANITFHMEGY